MADVPPIDALPTPPSRGDAPEVFRASADALLGALPDFVDQVNAAGDAMEEAVAEAVGAIGGSVTGTSATSASIGTGSKGPFVAEADKNWGIGTWLAFTSSGSPGNWMIGQVTAYSGANVTINVPSGSTNGSGTFTDWSITIAQAPPAYAAVNKAGDTMTGLLVLSGDPATGLGAATKQYVDNAVVGLWDIKGSTNCSSNPNYPSALKGDAYLVSTAGKIGGASGKSVDIGDWYVCVADEDGGTEASVGTSWTVIEHNLNGLAPLASPAFTGTATAVNFELSGYTKAAVTAAAASAIDCSLGNAFTKTASGSLTWTFTNVPAGFDVVVLKLTNGGAGAQTWPASVKWPGAIAPTLQASGVDILRFATFDGGTTWNGVHVDKDSR